MGLKGQNVQTRKADSGIPFMRVVNAVVKTLRPQVPQQQLLRVQQEVYHDVGRCLDNRNSAIKKKL